MTSKNDITGDRLINKTLSKEGEANWDKIFSNKNKKISRINVNEGIHYEVELDKSTGEPVKKFYNREKKTDGNL